MIFFAISIISSDSAVYVKRTPSHRPAAVSAAKKFNRGSAYAEPPSRNRYGVPGATPKVFASRRRDRLRSAAPPQPKRIRQRTPKTAKGFRARGPAFAKATAWQAAIRGQRMEVRDQRSASGPYGPTPRREIRRRLEGICLAPTARYLY